MSPRVPLLIFLAWTVLVWTSRVRNVLADDDLSTGGTVWRLGAAVLFVVLAGAVVVTRRAAPARAAAVLGTLVVWTVGWWTVRGIGIIVDDHELGFTVIHTLLMAVSIGLAMWAWARRNG